MATALPGCGRLPAATGEDHKVYRAVHGVSLPHRTRRPEFNHPSIVARYGAAQLAIPALISPLEPTSLPLITTAKLYLTIFGAGLLAYLLSRSEEVRIRDNTPWKHG